MARQRLGVRALLRRFCGRRPAQGSRALGTANVSSDGLRPFGSQNLLTSIPTEVHGRASTNRILRIGTLNRPFVVPALAGPSGRLKAGLQTRGRFMVASTK